MFRKIALQAIVLALFALAMFGTPFRARAGGVCGGTYIVEQGETLDSIAATCGTTVAAILAANPGISASLYAGQAIVVPGLAYAPPAAPIATAEPVVSSNIYNYYYNTYNYYSSPSPVYNPPPPVSNSGYSGTYVVQYGDTFSAIASRFGVGMYDLWAANPNIWDINLLYAGQVIRVPAGPLYPLPPYYGPAIPTAPTQASVPLSYGTVPAGTPYGKVRLSNQAGADVYVSLQGTTRDGIDVINEYPVGGTMSVNIPAGWYVYVAWVGGFKYSGQFNLGGGENRSITFYNNSVMVE